MTVNRRNFFKTLGAVGVTLTLGKELERFKDFIAESINKYSSETSHIILQDGGEIRVNSLSEMPDEIWQDFQEEFLNIAS